MFSKKLNGLGAWYTDLLGIGGQVASIGSQVGWWGQDGSSGTSSSSNASISCVKAGGSWDTSTSTCKSQTSTDLTKYFTTKNIILAFGGIIVLTLILNMNKSGKTQVIEI